MIGKSLSCIAWLCTGMGFKVWLGKDVCMGLATGGRPEVPSYTNPVFIDEGSAMSQVFIKETAAQRMDQVGTQGLVSGGPYLNPGVSAPIWHGLPHTRALQSVFPGALGPHGGGSPYSHSRRRKKLTIPSDISVACIWLSRKLSRETIPPRHFHLELATPFSIKV